MPSYSTHRSRWALYSLFFLHTWLMGIDACSSSRDADGDGVSEEEGDCDDSDPNTYPGAPETCDLKDNDCNGIPDDAAAVRYYPDTDADGFGDALSAAFFSACAGIPAGFVTNGADCDDTNPSIYPALAPNGTPSDFDCDGEVDTFVRTAGIDWLETDGQPATQVPLGDIQDVEVGDQGDVYAIADDVLRRIGPDGVITTFAGTGVKGHTGDGGPASEAQLHYPNGLARDRTGNLFLSCGAAIRRIDTSGIITTVAGSSTMEAGPAVDNVQATRSYMGPEAVAVDAQGQLFIADYFNSRIRKVRTDGIIVTIAGNGDEEAYGDGGPATEAGLNQPKGVAVNAAGEVFLSQWDGFVRKVALDGIISTVAGTWDIAGNGVKEGWATEIRLNNIEELAIDAAGNLYIASEESLRRLEPDGWMTTVAGGGSDECLDGTPATSVSVRPVGAAVNPEGEIFLAGRQDGRVFRVDVAGLIHLVAGNGGYSGDGGPASLATLWGPAAVALSPQGELFIADANNGRIRKVDAAGIITTVAGGGTQTEGNADEVWIEAVSDMVFDPAGNLYFTNSTRVRKLDTANRVTTIAGNGSYTSAGDGGPATAASLAGATGLALDASGNLYVAEMSGHRVRRIDLSGIIVTAVGTGVAGFSGDDGPASLAQLSYPYGLAMDPSGALFIAEDGNDRIRRVDGAGIITTIAGSGENGDADDGPAESVVIGAPAGIAFSADGILFIADTEQEVIRALTPDGAVYAVAGIDSHALEGDFGPARTTLLTSPMDVSAAPDGTLFVADTGGNTILQWRP